MSETKKYRVAVCGTRFGEHYLAALTRHRSEFELSGIVANGSERSRLLAQTLAVPMYSNVEQLPDDIDIACVVVRSRIVGGAGSDMAEGLLKRGISVLQEHPVHPSDIARLKTLAEENNVHYHVNTLYPALPSGACFIDYARQSAEQNRPEFIEITTSLQLLYSSLEIVNRALTGLSPFTCTAPSLPPSSATGLWPFRQMQGEIQGIPFCLNLQTTLDPSDPDHHSLVMHRITIGGTQGNVCLTNSFGPVVWSHSIYAPNYQEDAMEASWLLSPEKHQSSRFNQQPTAIVLDQPRSPNLIEATRSQFPVAILGGLRELIAGYSGAWQSHGQAWLQIMRNAGQPQYIACDEPVTPFPDPMNFAEQQQNDPKERVYVGQ